MRKTIIVLSLVASMLFAAPSALGARPTLTSGTIHLVGQIHVRNIPDQQGNNQVFAAKPLHYPNLHALTQQKAHAAQLGFTPLGENSKQIATTSTPSPLTVTSGLTLEGPPGGSPNPCLCTPPDIGLGVGPTHVFQMVNLAGIIYTKAGVLAKATFSLDSFFLLPISSMSDPEVTFDWQSSRWFASIIDKPNGHVQFAVSTSSDPTGTWKIYFVSTIAPTIFPDQPFIATSDDKFVISVNDFDTNAHTFYGVQYWVLNKSQLVAGAATANFVTNTPDATIFSLHPARHLTTTSIFYMITNCLSDCLADPSMTTSSARLVAISGTPPGTVTVTGNTFSIITSSPPPNAVQPGTYSSLTTNDNRVLSATWESNNLWFSSNDACIPSGDNATRSCLRLIQITTSGTSPPTKVSDFDYSAYRQYLFYPAVSLFQGQLAVVYGSSSFTVFPSLLVAGRAPTDPANTLETPFTIRSGTAFDPSARYGDYFDAATDPTPTSTSTFWVGGEYRISSDSVSWNTAIASVALTFHFALSAASYALSFLPSYTDGGSDYTTLTASLISGFSPVSFSASGWPWTISFSKPTVNPTATSDVTFSIPPGYIFRSTTTYNVLITATGVSESHNVTIAVTVQKNCFCVPA